jgi:hypothetical protein
MGRVFVVALLALLHPSVAFDEPAVDPDGVVTYVLYLVTCSLKPPCGLPIPGPLPEVGND